MKPTTKNLLIGAAVAIAIGSYFIYDKVSTAITVFDKIRIKPVGLPKNVVFSNNNSLGIPQTVTLKMDVKIENPEYQEFSVSGYGVATLKQVDVYYKSFHVGTANLHLEEILVPAKSSVIIPNVTFTGGTLWIFQNATAFQNAQLSDLRFTGIIEALGTDYEIG